MAAVGLVFNLKSQYPWRPDSPADADADVEDRETVHAVDSALRGLGHTVSRLHYGPELAERIGDGFDVIFNMAEGWTGRSRESLVPGLAELVETPYTGSDAVALGVSMDKALAKQVASSSGVPTADFRVISEAADLRDVDLPYPRFVKPCWEGSSMGVRQSSLVRGDEEQAAEVSWVLRTYQQPALLESYLPGREFCVGMVGNRPELRIFPVAEVIAQDADSSALPFYSSESKGVHRKRVVCPADISDALASEMQSLGARVFAALGGRDVARADFKLDGDGRPCFLEVNLLPGLNPDYSIYPAQARAAGMSYPELIGAILARALHLADSGDTEQTLSEESFHRAS
jgi:D-alanine-D-alanine ligase